MTGKDVERIIRRLELTRAEFAVICSIHNQTVYKWLRAGETTIPLSPALERFTLALEKVSERRHAALMGRALYREAIEAPINLFGVLARMAEGTWDIDEIPVKPSAKSARQGKD